MRRLLGRLLKNPIFIIAGMFGGLAFIGLGPCTKLSLLKRFEGVDAISISRSGYTSGRSWEIVLCNEGDPLEDMIIQILAEGAATISADIEGTSITFRRGKGVGRFEYNPVSDAAHAAAKGTAYTARKSILAKGSSIRLVVNFHADQVPIEPFIQISARGLRRTDTDMLNAATLARRMAGLLSFVFFLWAVITSSRDEDESADG